jgi:hypothetical protein
MQVLEKIDCGVLGIGICMKDAFYAKTFCGWRKWCFGWHSDSDLFWNASSFSQFDNVKKKFGVGDVVGVGIERNQLYLTLNGSLLGKIT